MKYLPIFLPIFLLACSGSKTPDSTSTACQRALADLAADRDAGMPCEAAKARALVAEPGCPLNFTCKDGGR